MLRIFKNKVFLIVSITIIILTVMVVSAQSNGSSGWMGNTVSTVMSPFQKAFSYIGNGLNTYITFLRNLEAVKAENEDLKNQVAELEKENRELMGYKDENRQLKESLNIKDQFTDYEAIGANIIARDLGNWFNVFTVDRGSKDGINVNRIDLISNYFPVMTNRGLVGRVISSSAITSKVISIIDEDSTVMGRVVSNNELVRVKGDVGLKEQGLCRIDYISPEVDISSGDIIETSGLGGIYPRGILIGRVTEVRLSNSSANRYAIVEPAVNFKKLDKVLLLKSKPKD